MTVRNLVREHQAAPSSRATFEVLLEFVERHKHHFWRWIVAALCFASSCAHAQSSVRLAWDRNTETNIAGYRVYSGVASRVYTNMVNVGNVTTASVTNLVAGVTYRFAVTAYNTTGAESDFSSEISFTTTNNLPTNVPPTLGAISNLAINEDSGSRSVALTGIGSGGENQTVTVTASATPPSLIPSVQVNYTSPNPTGTISFVTATNASGTGTVSVAVSDGLAQTVRSFQVTVNPVNDQPVVSTIASPTIAEDTSTPAIPFTVGDIDTAAANLAVSGTSLNLTLVPNGNVIVGGSGANRTVQVTPAANQSGVASIQVTVSDGALSATRTFDVTVTASNDPPTIAALPAATVPALTATVLQPVVIGDIDTAASSLVVTGTSSVAKASMLTLMKA